MDWQTKRKFLYGTSFLILLIGFLFYSFKDTLFPSPTCIDKKQNGYELGVDCGGVCSLRCTSEVVPLKVLWSKALQVSQSEYDLVGMISNKNVDNSSQGVSYVFTVFNLNGEVIKEVKGSSYTPTEGDFPIMEQSVVLGQIPRNVELSLEEGPHFTVAEIGTTPILRVSNEHFETTDVSRLYSTITNTRRSTIDSIPVIAILYDQKNNAYAVGKTFIQRLYKIESKDISFTWNTKLKTDPVRIKIYPILDPFLYFQ